MEAALVWYTLLNLAILALIVLFVRATRARAVPNERQDLEENALGTADWEWVRRERCLPSACPRVRGQPPRPRKDVTCEICATTFLAIRLQRLLESPPAREPVLPESAERVIVEGMSGAAHSVVSPVSRPLTIRGKASRLEPRPAGSGLQPETTKQRHRGTDRRWPRIRFALGIGFVAAGAAVAVFGGLLWLIVPGYLIVLVGLGLIVSSAATGAL